MTDKTLENKAVDIKGKKYVLVSDRIIYFNDKYPKGSIKTELVTEPLSNYIVIKATVIPEEGREFNGYAQEKVGEGYINKTSALENAETSAVGRALAMLGIGVIDSIASVDEVNKANNQAKAQPSNDKALIKKLCDDLDHTLDTKEDYEKFVLTQTKLALNPRNYEEIINRLKAMKEETNE